MLLNLSSRGAKRRETPSIWRFACTCFWRQPLRAESSLGDRLRFRAAGFTLIELIIVISIMLILISIAAPIYRTSIIRSREAVLRDNLFTMRALIDQYTVDKQE